MEGPEIKFAEAVLDNGKFGTRTVRFEAGRLAQQAQGAVAAYLDEETMLLSATSIGKHPKDNFDFFPLTIDVEERSYAAGKIPGSFFRREGRPSTEAILVCRLIDRPLRPSFVNGLRNEVQVVITVLSIAPDEFYDTLAINAASASSQISGIPFSGPIAGVRLALIGDQWVAFPKYSQLEEAVFDLVVAGRVVTDAQGNEDVAIMMVEAEATENSWNLIQAGATKPNEEIVAQGLEAAKPFLKQLVAAQASLAAQVNKAVRDYPVFPAYSQAGYDAVAELAYDELVSIYQIADKTERQDADDALKERVKLAINDKVSAGELSGDIPPMVSAAYKSVTKTVVRGRILTEGIRIDGRGLADIRPLDAEVQVIPRVHGSAIFQRGETQILGVTTLNMLKMEQQIDSLSPIKKKRYLHHYNFPPYSTGETGRVGSPKRREIGHGFLAERAIAPVLPSRDEFPYAIRQVSEALGSNGSTSMGSVCASTLSLLNAGVPLRAPVAGIAMGLVSDTIDGETRYAALTDILGAEDALGDMDFKVAGTSEFITAIQLDTKLDGLPTSVLDGALRDGPDRAPRDQRPDPGRQDRRADRPEGQDDQLDPGRDRRRHLHRGRRHRVHRRRRRSLRRGCACAGQRDRQPDEPRGRRAVPRNRRQDRHVRCVRVASPRQGRPAAHQRGAQARRWQARRERRRRARCRPEDPRRDHQDRRPRKAVARARRGRRRRGWRHRGFRCRQRRPRGPGRRLVSLRTKARSTDGGTGFRRFARLATTLPS
jgi:polyribonucleotide nucleotidyltransferase